MTKLELFNKLITKAKSNGYSGPSGEHIGQIIDGTNVYSIFFREDFALSIWGDGCENTPSTINWEIYLAKLAMTKDKWKFMEDNVDFD